MAENPLLPHAELRALYALTKRCAAAATGAAGRGPAKPGALAARRSRAALLSATTLQLQPGDALIGMNVDRKLAPLPLKGDAESAHVHALPDLGKANAALLLGAAMAAGMQTAGTDHIVLAMLEADALQPNWAAALRWAAARRLPLVIVCGDTAGDRASLSAPTTAPAVFHWAAVHRESTRSKLPILTVDGEDAVAVYRCMQESVLRARAGGGPAMLWASLPSPRQLRGTRPQTADPLKRLRQYMRSRKISLRESA